MSDLTELPQPSKGTAKLDAAGTTSGDAKVLSQGEFVAEIAHDLGNSVTALNTIAALLSRPDFPAQGRETMVGSIKSEVDYIVELINELRNWTYDRPEPIRLEVQPFDMGQVIAESVAIIRHLGDSKGITISVDSVPSPFFVNGDRGQIRRVLVNLIGNAIKYNREGGYVHIQMQIGLTHERPVVEVAVSDTGWGIAEEDQAHLFERHFRAARAAKLPGTGLGLAIVREILEAHDGNIWVKSALGQGSTFFFTLPITT